MGTPRQTLITSAEAAALLFVHQSTLSRMVAAGRITPAMRAGTGPRAPMLFDQATVEALVAERAAS